MVHKTQGTVKYCGYVIGREKGQITPEQVERLFQFIHANYYPAELVKLTDEQLHEIASANRSEWR